MTYRNPTVGKRLAHQIAGMDALPVRPNLLYAEPGGQQYGFDVYYPGGWSVGDQSPFVIVGGPPAFHAGKSSGQKVGWSQLIAASGMIAIAFDHRSDDILKTPQDPCDDIVSLIEHVRTNASGIGVDPERMGTLGFSFGTAPWHLWAVLREPMPFVRCNVVYYGALDFEDVDGFSPEQRAEYAAITYLRRHSGRIPPMLVAKAGKDRFTAINNSIDRYIVAARELGAPVELLEHPDGPHGFDGRLSDGRSVAIIRRTLEFMKTRLLSTVAASTTSETRPR